MIENTGISADFKLYVITYIVLAYSLKTKYWRRCCFNKPLGFSWKTCQEIFISVSTQFIFTGSQCRLSLL